MRFGAGHTNDSEWCGEKPHGHEYVVTVTWEREGFPKTDLEQWTRYRDAVLQLALELKNRDLGVQLGPQEPNVFGVAAFFMDRLAIIVPVTKVEVHESDGPIAIIDRTSDY